MGAAGVAAIVVFVELEGGAGAAHGFEVYAEAVDVFVECEGEAEGGAVVVDGGVDGGLVEGEGHVDPFAVVWCGEGSCAGGVEEVVVFGGADFGFPDAGGDGLPCWGFCGGDVCGGEEGAEGGDEGLWFH